MKVGDLIVSHLNMVALHETDGTLRLLEMDGSTFLGQRIFRIFGVLLGADGEDVFVLVDDLVYVAQRDRMTTA